MGKSLGKSLENMGKSLEICKIIGKYVKIWENHGKYMEILWEIHEKNHELNGGL